MRIPRSGRKIIRVGLGLEVLGREIEYPANLPGQLIFSAPKTSTVMEYSFRVLIKEKGNCFCYIIYQCRILDSKIVHSYISRLTNKLNGRSNHRLLLPGVKSIEERDSQDN